MLVTSRSFAEYAAFFDLTEEALRGRRVLDCSAGASSFTVEAAGRRFDVIAVDPVFAEPEAAIAAGYAATDKGTAIIDAHDDRFVWRWYGDPARRAAMRAHAFDLFADDLRRHPSRYVAASLPHLPFAADAFDLALCSHLLFTWGEMFDGEWHAAALQELLRVAREVRVFPLILQGSGRPVEFLQSVTAELEAGGVAAEVVRVPYEFQVGGDHMLRLRRA